MRMGVYGVPGTFPTGKLADALNDADPLIKQGEAPEWSRDAVNSLYFHYKSGVMEGDIPAWHKSEFKDDIKEYMSEISSLPSEYISRFFTMFEYLTESGEIDPLFLEVERPKADPMARLKDTAEGAGETFKNTISSVKWIGIAGIVGVSLWLGYPYIKTLTRRAGR